MADFLAALRERVVLGDGAMGTELLARGASPRSNLSLLNLENPELVLQVHRDYAAAGAELLRTNTFMANRLRMDPARVREVNLEGARLARGAAGPEKVVAGSVGPLRDILLSVDERRRAFEEQCRALVDGGCDALILETFGAVEDLMDAVGAARQVGVPVVAQTFTASIPISGASLANAGATVVGANCAGWTESLQIILQWKDDRPERLLSTFPNAGQPGAYFAPEEFAVGVQLLLDKGVRLIGGCCGTTPEHIRALARRLGR